MKTILLPCYEGLLSSLAIDAAQRFAHHFGSHLEGLFIRRLPPIMAGEGMTLPAGYLATFAEEGRQLAADAKQRFEHAMQESGIPLRDIEDLSGGPSAGWRESDGPANEVMGGYGRLFDLIIIGRDRENVQSDWNAVMEGALFESGRPLLVTGTETRVLPPKTIVIVWNGSTETARTIGLGMPLLYDSDKVVVLSVEEAMVAGPKGEQVASHLRRHGLQASAVTVSAGGRGSGEAILEEAESLGADLLFKGAYTNSRLRQMIFGGATRHILAHARLPVLIAH